MAKMITLGIDFETSSKPIMHPWQKRAFAVMFGIAREDGTTKTWVFNHDDVQDIDQRKNIDEIQKEINTAGRIVGHNIKFDLNWLRKLGITFDHCKVYCTQVAEYILRNQRIGNLSLEDLSDKYLETPKLDKIKMYWESGYETSEIPMHVLRPYLEQDCINALGIFKAQAALLRGRSLMSKTVALQCEASRVLSEIECNGFKFDKNIAEKAHKELVQELAELDADLLLAFDFDCNLNSNDELSAALFGGIIKRQGKEYYPRKLKAYLTAKDMCPLEYKSRNCTIETKIKGAGFKPAEDSELKKEGYYSTDKGAIKHLVAKNKKQKQIKKLLMERSGKKKAIESLAGRNPAEKKGLLNKIQSDGRIHSKYNQTVAKTGRLSSSDPNGQNLPRKGTSPLKESIIPEFDFLLSADLSQIEWRCGAFQSQDKVMCEEIRSGFDPHTDNAIKLFKVKETDSNFDEIRTIAKIVSFRLLYGGSAYGFYMDAKMPSYSLKFWEEVVEAFYDKYEGLAQWQKDNFSKVYQNKGLLPSITGRIYEFHMGKSGYRRPQVCNFPVQGFATADIMPLAMCIIAKQMKKHNFKSKMILQVHDEIVFDVIASEAKALARLCIDVFEALPKYIENYWGFKFNLPLTGDIDVGLNYCNMEPFTNF